MLMRNLQYNYNQSNLYQKTNRFYSLKSKYSKQIMSYLKNNKLDFVWSR